MYEVVIRRREATDLDACVEALRAVHDADAYPLNWPTDPHRWLTPARLLRAWIAECPRGTIAGHVAVQRAPDATGNQMPSPGAELSRLYVTPAARRRGVATALLHRARSWAAEHRHQLTLNVTDDRRSAAVAFYEADGWRHSHTEDADWTTPDGTPVKLRHYVLGGEER
ncbi:GNAT family N-acetyltransferase [Polymorphospora sp. NPDC051019]|uniref:GNAT family N-acetyltransferase n=1 Tax=Polymorphospora sp. NPDC051019 TaxID=3155725 RepID=UPI003428AAED